MSNTESASTVVQREIVAADGRAIVAKFFLPQGEPKGAVLIASAMGVSQKYYAAFAAWLSAQGFVAATFDYRGTGLSLRGRLRDVGADILDWARLDCAAMVDALAPHANGGPVFWVGHSLGGQIFPLVPNRASLSKIITVATGSGYWRENAPPLRRRVWWLWYVAVPVALRVYGYFPGKRLRKVGDLPRGVIEQWRRWCLNRDYAIGVEGDEVRQQFASVDLPVVSLSFTDDEYMSARNVSAIHGCFARSAVTLTRLAPKDVGATRIGHFGFFRAAFEQSLWATYLLPELRAVTR